MMLKISGLHVCYGDKQVLVDSQFEADVGLTCVIGESGSGKSSLLNALMMQIPCKWDEYQVNGETVDQDFIRHHMAYFVQGSNFISDMTCFDNLALYGKIANVKIDDKKVKEYLKYVQLEIDDKTYPDNLSGGEKQKLALVQALLKESPVILCDELTASLDYAVKKEIVQLLQTIAQRYQKIIIMTSHDEDIQEMCDRIYEIDKQQLNLIKESKTTEALVATKVEKREITRLKAKDFKQYVQAKIERQYGMFMLSTLICAIVISVSCFLTVFYKTYIEEQHTILNKLVQTELFVINQTKPVTSLFSDYSYNASHLPFAEDVVKQLTAVEDVASVYPYYICNLDNVQYVPNPIDFVFESEDGKKVYPLYPNDIWVYPYYPEQGFDEKQLTTNLAHLNEGIYLNQSFYGCIDIPLEELGKYQLQVTLYLPVTYTVGTSLIESRNEDGEYMGSVEYPDCQVKYQAVEVSLPIAGVMDPTFNEEWGNVGFYVPYDVLDGLRKEALTKVSITGDEKYWQPNAYVVYAKDVEDLDQIRESIKAIDANIGCGNKYLNNQAMYASRNYINRVTLAVLFIVLGAGMLLSYAYGIYYYQKNKEDVRYFKRNGLIKQELWAMLVEDVKLQSIVTLLLSYLLMVVIFYLGHRFGLMGFYLVKDEIVLIILLGMVLLAVQTLISRMDYIRHISKEE